MEQQYEDLKEKYDALAQKLLTMELERQEYEKEIKQIVTHNLELKQSNRANLEALQLDQYTKLSLETMSTALNQADSLQQEISAQNDEYKNLNDELIEENNVLREQNKKYQLTLENMNHNAQKKELEYQNKIEMLENKIMESNNEQNKMNAKYDQISDEMNKLKQETDQQLKTQMEAISPPADVGKLLSDNKTLHLNFLKSIPANELHSMESVTDHSNPYSYDMNSNTLQFENDYAGDMFGKEKEQLIEKYILEINELNQQIVSYKKKIMQKNIHINQLKSKQLNGVKNGRNQFIERPNNQQDLSKCKMFGWTVW